MFDLSCVSPDIGVLDFLSIIISSHLSISSQITPRPSSSCRCRECAMSRAVNSNNTAVFVLRLEIGLLLKHTCNLLIVSWSVTFVLIDTVDEFSVCSLVCFYCILSQQVSSLTCGSKSLCSLSRSEFVRAICIRARNFAMFTRRVSIQENINSRKQQMSINLANLFNAPEVLSTK